MYTAPVYFHHIQTRISQATGNMFSTITTTYEIHSMLYCFIAICLDLYAAFDTHTHSQPWDSHWTYADRVWGVWLRSDIDSWTRFIKMRQHHAASCSRLPLGSKFAFTSAGGSTVRHFRRGCNASHLAVDAICSTVRSQWPIVTDHGVQYYQ